MACGPIFSKRKANKVPPGVVSAFRVDILAMRRRILPTLGTLFVLSGEVFFEEGGGEGFGEDVEFAEEVFEIGGGAGFEGGADFLDEV